MRNPFLLSFLLLIGLIANAQTNSFTISFDNAVHHEAEVKATFPDITESTFSVRMSRTSPGRYAIHEFAKNVYNVVATDSKGKELDIVRPNPYQWDITGHDGTVNISYTLYADHGDGTYSQIDETHAHLNIPATFMFAPSQADRGVEVTFNVREDLNWKVATQLKQVSGNTYSAPNLQYFMDSPTEISNWDMRQFEVESSGKKYDIRFVLHHNGTAADLDTYFEKVKKIVLAEKDVYGELADYDFGTYTFLACYLPNVSGDGMEHRNSTILTDRDGLADGGMEGNIGTVSHEFFHSWNVERIRPQVLEPFDFTEANMSGELWFAEGFTSYYTGLILCRAGVIT
ncbi:MAG: M61 family peptidase, partial [Fulvivirga sp.]